MMGSRKDELKVSGLTGLAERLQRLGAIAFGFGGATAGEERVSWSAMQEAARAARARELELSQNLRYRYLVR